MNATTRYPIQVYQGVTPSINFDLKLINGYINVVGGNNGLYSTVWYNRVIPLNYDLQNLPSLTKSTSVSFTLTNDYNFTDETLLNHSLSSDPTPSSYNLNEANYGMVLISSESIILSLPDSLNQNITVSPGQNISFDLP